LLDITADEIKTGKTTGSDVENNKLTLATIHLLKTVDEGQRQKIYKMLEYKQFRYSVRDMLRTSGSLKYAYMRAKDFVDKAIEALDSLAYSDAKEALIETARFLAGRAT
jgi:geranylgeranyl pyrophosphate synthase